MIVDLALHFVGMDEALRDQLGLAPWLKTENVGREISDLRHKVKSLTAGPRAYGSLEFVMHQVETLQRKLWTRSNTPPMGNEPVRTDPIQPPDFWLTPQVQQHDVQLVALEKQVKLLSEQLASVYAQLGISVPETAEVAHPSLPPSSVAPAADMSTQDLIPALPPPHPGRPHDDAEGDGTHEYEYGDNPPAKRRRS